MGGREPQADHCPHCGAAFEIVSVKFRLTRTAMLSACPNCTIAPSGAGSAIPPKPQRFANIGRSLRQAIAISKDPLKIRLRYILAFLFGAMIAAAALRHGAHVYGGVSREDIREYALIAVPFVALAVISLRRKRLL